MDTEKMMHGGIAAAVQTRRKEFLRVSMRQLRKQAEEGQFSTADLDLLLNTVEALANTLIEE